MVSREIGGLGLVGIWGVSDMSDVALTSRGLVRPAIAMAGIVVDLPMRGLEADVAATGSWFSS